MREQEAQARADARPAVEPAPAIGPAPAPRVEEAAAPAPSRWWSRNWPRLVIAIALLALGVSAGVLLERWRASRAGAGGVKPARRVGAAPHPVPDPMPEPALPRN